MHYTEALEYVYGLADFERSSSQRVRFREFNLDRVRALLQEVDNPHQKRPSVHVAGTKGKGSTVAMVSEVLSASGLKSGMLSSPHLHRLVERFQVSGEPIPEAEFARQVARLQPEVDRMNKEALWGRLTTFEVLTVVAFTYFLDAGVDAMVLEVGLGGRLDATNVVVPAISAITNISLDHVEILGHDLPTIAEEKAGIIKPGVPVVSAPQTEEVLRVLSRRASEAGSELVLVGRDVDWSVDSRGFGGQSVKVDTARARYEFALPLLGDHQAENAAMAVAICERLNDQGLQVGKSSVEEGLAAVSWPGRMETLCHEPLIIVDGAHNQHSMRRLVDALQQYFTSRHVVVVFGTGSNKHLGGMVTEIEALPGVVSVATQSAHPKATPAREVAAELQAHGLTVEIEVDTAEALSRARSMMEPSGLILVTGSLFVVAEVREVLLGIRPETGPWLDPRRN